MGGSSPDRPERSIMSDPRNIAQGIETRKKIKDFIISYISEHGYPPTYQEIADGVGFCLPLIKRHMDRMFANGELETDGTDRRNGRKIRVPGYVFVKAET